MSTSDVSTSGQHRHAEPDLATQPIDAEQSLGDLFGRLGEDLGELVSAQMELARKELTDEVKSSGQAAGLLGVGTVVGYLSLTLVCFAAAWGLSEFVPEGVAFLIVAVVVGLVAGVLVMAGRRRMEQVRKIAPETVETLKEDAEWARRQIR